MTPLVLEILPSAINFAPELDAATLAVGILGNAACAIVGCYLVLRQLSLLGDAISHAVLPGIVVAVLLSGSLTGWPIFLGAVAVGILTAFCTGALHTFGNVPEDASMGVVFTSFFAIGVILITQFASQVDLDPSCVLYGAIENVPFDTFHWMGREIPRAVVSLGIVFLVTCGFVVLLWKELKLVAFDPTLATAMGYPAQLIYYLLMAMVAIVTVASFEAVGSVLVVAMLIVPAATAHLLTDRLGWMMVWAVGCGALSAILGYYAAAVLDINVPGMMAVTAGLLFLLAVVFSPRHGVVSKVVSTLRLSIRIIREDVLAQLYRSEENAARGEVAAAPGVTWQACLAFGGGGVPARLALGLLRQRGLIRLEAQDQVRLTEVGRRRAQSLVRSHRLWEAFLDKHFDLPLDHLHEAASRIEHYIGPGLQSELEADLQLPGKDPHGRSIPPAEEPR